MRWPGRSGVSAVSPSAPPGPPTACTCSAPLPLRPEGVPVPRPYSPEPYSDFTDPAKKAAYELALAGVRARFGVSYGLVIDGEWLETGATITSVNPARPAEVVGVIAAGGVEEAERALRAAWAAFPGWAARSAGERGRIGVEVAAIMRRNKYELAAIETPEAGERRVG